jgi:ATP-dependent RNA helicase DDX24/MAK5
MQTFVFSATLSKDLQQNLKRRHKATKKGVKRASALGECHYSYGSPRAC